MPPVAGRRAFLRQAILADAPPSIRPPWALGEEEFIARCERCGECAEACPDGLIVLGDGGFPRMEFARGGCDFCGACLEACKGRALVGEVEDEAGAWVHGIVVGDGCIAEKGVVCRSCADACDFEAIGFRLRVGGAARPEYHASRCTGCGACIPVCPVQAIGVDPSRRGGAATVSEASDGNL